MEAIYYESSLCHHGIKGQKWGVRRFQNEDGSLTSKGEARYGGDSPKSNHSFSKAMGMARQAKEDRLSAKVKKYDSVKNYYKNPIKFRKKLRAESKLYAMKTKDGSKKQKGIMNKMEYRFRRTFDRPAVSITGKEVKAPRAYVEAALVTMGVMTVNAAAAAYIRNR